MYSFHSDPSNAFAFIKIRMNYQHAQADSSMYVDLLSSCSLSTPKSNSLGSAICFSTVDSLASLLDSLKNLFVSQGILRDDGGRLRLETYVVGFDACEIKD